MNVRNMKNRFYNWLVFHNMTISLEYFKYLETEGKDKNGIFKSLKIFQLNWKYRICERVFNRKSNKVTLPEFHTTMAEPIENLVNKLSRYDVISFDIFDTLIFRAVEHPKDVFRIIEKEWNISGFSTIRSEAEMKARKLKKEPAIQDIYAIIAEKMNVDAMSGIKREFDVERLVCFANPYMLEVFNRLKRMNKKIVIVSDMYFSQKELKILLQQCGYRNIDEIYVSCEYNEGKGDGCLQKIVEKVYGTDKSYIHIGDNPFSDIQGSRKIGWDAYYYPNVYAEGFKYRIIGMESIGASFYNGIVNAKVHGGLFPQNEYYELGFVYIGFIVVAFCQFVNNLYKSKDFNKVLFCGDDTEVLHKIYQQCFFSTDCMYISNSQLRNDEKILEQITNERVIFVNSGINEEVFKNTKEILQRADRKNILCVFLEKIQDEINIGSNIEYYTFKKVDKTRTRYIPCKNFKSQIRRNNEQCSAAVEVKMGIEDFALEFVKYYSVFGPSMNIDADEAFMPLENLIPKEYV